LTVAFAAILFTPMVLGAFALNGIRVNGLATPDPGGSGDRVDRAATAVRAVVEARCRHLAATAAGLAGSAAIAGQAFVTTPDNTQGPWAMCGVDPAANLGAGAPAGLAARAEIHRPRDTAETVESSGLIADSVVGYAYAVQPLDAAFLAELSAAAGGSRVSLIIGGDGPEGSALEPTAAAPLRLWIEPEPLSRRDPVPVLLVVAGVAVLVSVLLGWWLAAVATQPLRRLLVTVDAVATGDLSARSALSGPDETGRLGQRLDQLIIEMQETRRLSVTDPLTGLGNRRQLTDRLRLEIERASRFARPLGVLVLDVDHFKLINDRYGHQGGDRVLVELAERVRQAVREVDQVFRYGGEEFVILLPETDIVGSLTAAERIGDAVRHSVFPLHGQSAHGSTALISVTVSIGVSVFPHHAEAGSDLLESADQALYAAKAAGRDTVVLAGPAKDSLSVTNEDQLIINPVVHR
jgi:diguanylate cyclase (GGDEF)-like protein